MLRPRPVRAVGALLVVVTASLALWAAAAPPTTATVAPGAARLP